MPGIELGSRQDRRTRFASFSKCPRSFPRKFVGLSVCIYNWVCLPRVRVYGGSPHPYLLTEDPAANLRILGKVYMRLLLAEKVTDNFCDLKFEFRLGFNCISALAGSVLLSIRLPGFCKFAKCQALMMDERWCWKGLWLLGLCALLIQVLDTQQGIDNEVKLNDSSDEEGSFVIWWGLSQRLIMEPEKDVNNSDCWDNIIIL